MIQTLNPTGTVKKAKDVVLSSDLSNNSILPAINGKIPAVEIIALNNEGEIRDILWSSISRKDSLDLEQRILQKRKRIHRSWDAGDATTSVWSISSGLNLIIREDSKDPAIFLPSQPVSFKSLIFIQQFEGTLLGKWHIFKRIDLGICLLWCRRLDIVKRIAPCAVTTRLVRMD